MIGPLNTLSQSVELIQKARLADQTEVNIPADPLHINCISATGGLLFWEISHCFLFLKGFFCEEEILFGGVYSCLRRSEFLHF